MVFRNNEGGQILLIVVLAMIVALTVGLSIVSRTVTELKLARQNEESQRAFQAAEAGIEQALQQTPSSQIITFDKTFTTNNSAFSTKITAQDGTTILLNNGERVDQATGADVWLSDHPNFENQVSGSLILYWGESSQNCAVLSGNAVMPALEVIILDGNLSNPNLTKYIFDSCGTGRTPGSTDSSGSATIGGVVFSNSTSSIVISSGIIMKVIPIYNSTVVGAVATGFTFPIQGSIIESTGTSGDTVRKVTYYQSFPQMPLEVFPYTILSQ